MAIPSEVSLLTATELATALAESAPLVLEAVLGAPLQTSFIPGTVLLDLAEIDVFREDALGSPLLVADNYNLRPPQ